MLLLILGTNHPWQFRKLKEKKYLDQSLSPLRGCPSAFKGSSSPLMSSEMLMSGFMLQVIQTVSAMDKDDPKNGHYFLYSLLPEMVNNPNFTIKKNEGKIYEASWNSIEYTVENRMWFHYLTANINEIILFSHKQLKTWCISQMAW